MQTYSRALLYLLTYPLFILSHYIPKDKNLLIFGSWHGIKYNDNSKYLFEYVNSNCRQFRAVWLSKNSDTIDKVNALGYEAYRMYSLRGIYLSIRAGYAFLSRAKSEDLPLFLSPNKTKIIQLWHGTPLKKLGRDSLANKKYTTGMRSVIVEKLKNTFYPHSGNPCFAFISSSSEVSKIIDSAYGDSIGKGGLIVAGYPRNDALFSKKDCVKSAFRYGIYMPTFRDQMRDASNLFFKYGFCFDEMESYLSGNGIILHIKLHPEAVLPDALITKFRKSEWIRIIDEEDIYSILGLYDFLVTDYSSIFFDYLLLDRPIIFAPFDLEDYLSSRGLYFDYDEITPGIKARNWPQVIDGIKIAIEASDKERADRLRVNEIVNMYRDDMNCKRVIDAVMTEHGQ